MNWNIICICNVIGRDDLISDPEYSTPKARLDKLSHIFETIEKWTMTKTKFEVVSICDPLGIPCGPILSMKEIAHDESLRRTGTIVEVDHPERGRYITVGCPIKLSNSEADVQRSPLLGEHNEEILKDFLNYSDEELVEINKTDAMTQPSPIPMTGCFLMQLNPNTRPYQTAITTSTITKCVKKCTQSLKSLLICQ